MLRDRRDTRLGWLAVLLVVAGCAGGFEPNTTVPSPRTEDIAASLILIGDAGKPKPGPPGDQVLNALRAEITRRDVETVVVFLGDNIYPRGLLGEEPQKEEQRLGDQVDAVLGTPAAGIFLPGNHDWAKGGDSGWSALQRAEAFVTRRGGPQVVYLPGGGCPGPAVRDVGQQLRVVILDTQWWLHGGPKPVDPESACRADSRRELLDSLAVDLAGADSRHVVVVAHHPLVSTGPHGGHFPWTDHIFPLREWKRWLWLPLPIIGSIYPLARKWGISSQDETSGEYRELIDSLDGVFARKPPLAYAAGHEHALEVLRGRTVPFLLVSGVGYYGHTEAVGRRDEHLYASAKSGFMRLDVLHDHRVRLGVWTVAQSGSATEVFSMWLE